MDKLDWVVRVSGVNFDATVFNTTDLSTIRGSSLVLEAFGYELAFRLKDRARLLTCGGSAAAFRIDGVDQTEAEKVLADIRNWLRDDWHHRTNWPPFVDWSILSDPDKLAAETGKLLFVETPSTHMTFVADLVAIAHSEDAALEAAAMRNRRRQMRAPSLPVSPGHKGASNVPTRAVSRCPVDENQQVPHDPTAADRAQVWARVGQFPASHAVLPDDHGLRRYQMSTRSADLRAYGRDARRTLYCQVAGPGLDRLIEKGLFATHDFAQSFSDMVDRPPAVAESVKGKLAFVHFDGNGFGAKLEAWKEAWPNRTQPLGRHQSATTAFADAIEKMHRRVFDWVVETFLDNSGDARDDPWTIERRVMVSVDDTGDLKPRDRRLMRMETLLAGGDDVTMVFPASLAWDLTWRVLERYAEAGAEVAAENGLGPDCALDYRAGLLICHSKTPARRARAFADALCTDAKAAGETPRLGWMVVESHDVPDLHDGTMQLNTLRVERQRAFGLGEMTEAERAAHAAPYRLTSETGDWLNVDMVALKKDFPRSQLYNLIRSAEQHLVAADGARAGLADYLDTKLGNIVDRARVPLDRDQAKRLLLGDGDHPDLRLKMLAELWDYHDPLADPVEDVV